MTEKTRDLNQYLDDCVTIEPVAIQEEYVRFPADLAFWNGKAADALQAHLHAKNNLERTEAQLQLTLREQFAAEGKKVTEAVITAAVTTHDEYQKAKVAAIAAEVEKARCSGYVDSLHSKREMLVSMGAHIRKEMDGDPVLREHMRGVKLAREG